MPTRTETVGRQRIINYLPEKQQTIACCIVERKKKYIFPCIYEKASLLEIFCFLVQFMKSLWRKQCFTSIIVQKPLSDLGNLCTTVHSLLNSGHSECNFLQIPLFKITWIICKQNSPEKVMKMLPIVFP